MHARPRIHFLHIGKTGGTALKHALSLRHVEEPAFEIITHPHGDRLRDVPAGEGVVFMIRDPISRFLSGFYSRLRQGRPRYDYPWSEAERRAFSRFRTPQELADSLDAWNPFRRSAARSAMRSIQHVRDSYWDWFEDEAYFLSRVPDFFFIGCQERMSEDFPILRAKLRLPETVRLPDDEVLAHRNPTYLDRTLPRRALANLRSWYSADFRFLEVCWEVLSRYPELGTCPARELPGAEIAGLQPASSGR